MAGSSNFAKIKSVARANKMAAWPTAQRTQKPIMRPIDHTL